MRIAVALTLMYFHLRERPATDAPAAPEPSAPPPEPSAPSQEV